MRSLVVMAKAPIAGQVKTRLCPPLDRTDAAALAEAFLLDALDQYAALLDIDVRLYLAGSWALSDTALRGASVHAQRGDGLKERLTHACEEVAALGFRQIVVIGADHPTLPTEYVAEAFAHLQAPQSAVIGPTEDGGFYLLGMNPYQPVAFDDGFSHSKVYRNALRRLEKGWEQVYTLPPWYDVDRPEDLHRLIQDPRTHTHSTHTYRLLCSLRRGDSIDCTTRTYE